MHLLDLRVPDHVVGVVLPANVNALALEVDVAPYEPENLASAYVRCNRYPDDRRAVRLLLGAKRGCQIKSQLVGERALRSLAFGLGAFKYSYELVLSSASATASSMNSDSAKLSMWMVLRVAFFEERSLSCSSDTILRERFSSSVPPQCFSIFGPAARLL